MDGAFNGRGSSTGVVLIDPDGLVLEQSFHFGFPASNNVVEYEVLLARLKLAKAVGANRVKAWSDS